MSMLWLYVLKFLMAWTVLSILFSLLLWPRIIRKMERQHPIVRRNDADNL